MGSPGATAAAGSPEGVLEDLTGSLQGWKRKLFTKKSGTPKRKDVSFLAPDGEEIRNKRQLDKYLKKHPGSLTVSDFDWSSGETPRRSARLSSKGRFSGDSIEGEAEAELVTSKRIKRQSRENGKDISSPKTPAKIGAGKDEVIQDAEKPEEKVAGEEHDSVVDESQKGIDKKAAEESTVEKNGEIEKEVVTREPKPMDIDAPVLDSKDVVAGESAAKPQETKPKEIVAPGEEDPVLPAVEESKVDVPTEATPKAVVAEEVEKVAPAPALLTDLNAKEPVIEEDAREQVDLPQPEEVLQVPAGAAESTVELVA
ncbi:unnamed protein product [Sphagnum balticum]